MLIKMSTTRSGKTYNTRTMWTTMDSATQTIQCGTRCFATERVKYNSFSESHCGALTLPELKKYCLDFFENVNDENFSLMNVTPLKISNATANTCFEVFHGLAYNILDAKISYSAFKAWFCKTPEDTPITLYNAIETIEKCISGQQFHKNVMNMVMRYDNAQILLDAFNTCECCNRHQVTRPAIVGPYEETKFNGTYNTEDPPCKCQCRHYSRWICRECV